MRARVVVAGLLCSAGAVYPVVNWGGELRSSQVQCVTVAGMPATIERAV